MLVSRGVDLSQYSDAEEFELLEMEKARLTIEFGREAVKIMAMARDSQHANALIEQLKKIYFIGYEDRKKTRVDEDVAELIEISKKTFSVRRGPGGYNLEIT